MRKDLIDSHLLGKNRSYQKALLEFCLHISPHPASESSSIILILFPETEIHHPNPLKNHSFHIRFFIFLEKHL